MSSYKLNSKEAMIRSIVQHYDAEKYCKMRDVVTHYSGGGAKENNMSLVLVPN